MKDTTLPIGPETTRIGGIRTGVMGRTMCGHLMNLTLPGLAFAQQLYQAVGTQALLLALAQLNQVDWKRKPP